jgi:anti-sigma B factor antagonist
MMSAVYVREEWHGDVPIARIEGEVDAANVAEVGARLRGLMTNLRMRLVVDLSATRYLDSAGINLLFAIGDELRARQQTLHLVVAEKSPVTRMLTITSLDRAHPAHTSVEDAIAAA